MRHAGHDVILVAGDERLEKLTYAEDFARAEVRLGATRRIRTGMGYDVHRLAPEEELWLCGVHIPHDRGLAGHSDADVAIDRKSDVEGKRVSVGVDLGGRGIR